MGCQGKIAAKAASFEKQRIAVCEFLQLPAETMRGTMRIT
jgi:hypothetical protein